MAGNASEMLYKYHVEQLVLVKSSSTPFLDSK